MTAKTYLSQLEVIDTMINQDLDRLDEIKTIACSSGGIDYKDRVQASTAGDTISNLVIRYMTLTEVITAEIDDFIDTKTRIIQEIRGLRHRNHIDILYKIYVQYKSVKTAAYEMGVSYQYARRLHQDAIRLFEDAYPNLNMQQSDTK